MNNIKISFCTTCMNRLHHLKQTLPKNIEENKSYPFIQFVLLDYNSKDGLEKWVRKQMMKYIENDLLLYLKTYDPQYFHTSHAKNMVSLYADGDVICNIDSDNFVGKDFSYYLNKQFNMHKDIFLTGRSPYGSRDTFGKICLKKSDFLLVRGYDESILGYGFEDDDLYTRLERIQRRKVPIMNSQFLRCISHDLNERLTNEYMLNNLQFILLDRLDKEAMEVILLKRDFSFKKGTLIPNKYQTGVPYCLKNKSWQQGVWVDRDNELLLRTDVNGSMTLKTNDGGYIYSSTSHSRKYTFTKLLDQKEIFEALYFYNLITNQEVYEKNKKSGKSNINLSGFGKGIVYKNFDYNKPVNANSIL
ncbi:glycosyltransferase family A protein [Fulvivirgaceae bacterium BMA12]|uniref:Glycosyltransferase family A protein n=1 Tax=Agaribacillus aureus TaxID=3051825 RepID=A0ABT8L9T8_9BACT|nr:glycosyltransferase family A protein [Fulvivirgaceae bacterium BMA12]